MHKFLIFTRLAVPQIIGNIFGKTSEVNENFSEY